MKTVLIYNDRGVSLESYHETLKMCQRFNLNNHLVIKTVSAHFLIQEKNWEESANLLIIPGGRETPYYEDLHQKGYQRIKKFVALGGHYLGICAGAYFGASRIIFEQGHPEHEVITERSLGLYSGTAEGPAYGLGRFQYNSEAGACLATIERPGDSKKSIQTYFNGGCFFTEPSQNDRVIARYADLPEKPIAIITCIYGKGHVSLSGVHFEYLLQDSLQESRDRLIQALDLF